MFGETFIAVPVEFAADVAETLSTLPPPFALQGTLTTNFPLYVGSFGSLLVWTRYDWPGVEVGAETAAVLAALVILTAMFLLIFGFVLLFAIIIPDPAEYSIQGTFITSLWLLSNWEGYVLPTSLEDGSIAACVTAVEDPSLAVPRVDTVITLGVVSVQGTFT